MAIACASCVSPELMMLVGGHPFLVRLALYYIARQDITLSQLLQTASTPFGISIYREYLQSLEELLAKQELAVPMREVAEANGGVRLESVTRFKLHSLGLVKLQGDEAMLRCELYRQYFQNN